MNTDEAALRQQLGVPEDARKVLVFGETSHWDPNWLCTTEEYYERRIGSILDRAIEALRVQPRRVFALESMYFVQMYWERRPEQRELLRRLLNEGRMRLTGSGVTTPDTVLPDTEAILRDYLHGQEWLRQRGITAEPRLAYLPDDFGHSPALPLMLVALGYDMAAITRIDGMYFIACDYRRKSCFPLSGSSAELLARQNKTLDFVWRGPDGAEVLCHWNAFSYFQGDMLAHIGIIRWMGKTYGFGWRTGRHIARRIRSYVRQLEPVSLTPYLFCPIGCDFNDPIEDLVGLLDRYNEEIYPQTGVWAVNAGMDDYLALVGAHRDKLPTLALDPNPYWMGFYASRQEAKLRCARITRKLILAEKLYALPSEGPLAQVASGAVAAALSPTATIPDTTGGGSTAPSPELARVPTLVDGVVSPAIAHNPTAPGETPGVRGYSSLGLGAPASRRVARLATGTVALWRDELEAAWDLLVLSNHHDFVTGTSPDRIWEAEQQPFLRKAEALVDQALQRVWPRDPVKPPQGVAPQWSLENGELRVETPHYRVELAEAAGGCLVSYYDVAAEQELLEGPSNDLISYKDTGGLWRMGHEYCGGSFRETDNSSRLPATISAEVKGAVLEVCVRSTLRGKSFERWLWFRNDTPIVRMHLVGTADKRHTVTCRFRTTLRAEELVMNVPGGIAHRPAKKVYDPTFWPALSFTHLHDQQNDRGLAVFLGGPAAPSMGDPGTIEWLAFRNAPKEKAFGCLPVLAHPARGTDPMEGAFDYAVWFTAAGDYLANQIPRHVRHALRAAMFGPDAPDLDELVSAIVQTDSTDVLVSALKPANRGYGLVARLRNLGPNGGTVRLRCADRSIRHARLCDARERDLQQLEVENGAAIVPLTGGLLSVRLSL